MAFVRSGSGYVGNGVLDNMGYAGWYWSRSSLSSDYARYLFMNTIGINASDTNMRNRAFPLRCLYPGSA